MSFNKWLPSNFLLSISPYSHKCNYMELCVLLLDLLESFSFNAKFLLCLFYHIKLPLNCPCDFLTVTIFILLRDLKSGFSTRKIKQNLTNQNQTQTQVPKHFFFLQSGKSPKVLENSILLSKMWRKILQKR